MPLPCGSLLVPIKYSIRQEVVRAQQEVHIYIIRYAENVEEKGQRRLQGGGAKDLGQRILPC